MAYTVYADDPTTTLKSMVAPSTTQQSMPQGLQDVFNTFEKQLNSNVAGGGILKDYLPGGSAPSQTVTPTLKDIVGPPTDVKKETKTEVPTITDAPKAPTYATVPTTTTSPTIDRSGQIQSMYDQSLANSISKLKQAIAKSKSDQETIKNNAPGQYNPLKDQVSFQGAQQSQNLNEMLANNGQQGGVNRTEQTQISSNTENNINKLNAQQQSVIDNANKAIADLESQGQFDEAQLVADNAKERLQALIAEGNRVDETNYNRLRDQVGDVNSANKDIYSKYRDSVADTNYKNETDYNKLRDQVSDTGKLANGQYTQSGQANATAEEMNRAKLKEQTDPNSVTNQMNQLGLDTAKINYAILDGTQKAQVDSILADLKGKQINNDQAQYQLNELNDPNSVTNQTKQVQLDTYKQDYNQQQKVNNEWLQQAPMRLKQAQEQVIQATTASQLAKAQLQTANEELLARKIDTANMTQQQKDAHTKVLADLADTKSAISNRASQLGIQKDQLALERDKFDWSKDLANPANIKKASTISNDNPEMKKYYSTDLSMGKTKALGTSTVDPLDNKQMTDWIMGLNRTPEYKLNLLNTLGVSK